MRIPFLLLVALLASTTSAQAQTDTTRKGTQKKPGPKSELAIEAGMTIAFAPSFHSGSQRLETSGGTMGTGLDAVIKYTTPSFSTVHLGLRLAVSTLRREGDLFTSYGSPIKVATQYASPLLQFGPQLHFDIPSLPGGIFFRLSPFVSFGQAWTKDPGVSGSLAANPSVGNSIGLQAGVDITARIKIERGVLLNISSGFQRSWMSFDERLGFAESFHMTHIPLNVGLGFLLQKRTTPRPPKKPKMYREGPDPRDLD